jgi:protein-tyrosine phosphatase
MGLIIMFNRILIVCIGNICRSPMAEALLKSRLADSHPEVKVDSAGLGALVGHPADPIARELMQERGIDISSHRARQLTPEMSSQYDLILTMEESQIYEVLTADPSAWGKVHCLGKWDDFAIPDPYHQSRGFFELALTLIDQGVADWASRISSMGTDSNDSAPPGNSLPRNIK